MPTIPGILASAAICLAAGVCVSCQQTKESAALSGKILVLDCAPAAKSFIFPDADKVSSSVRQLRDAGALTESDMVCPVRLTNINYHYSPDTKEFYEESQVMISDKPAVDGHGYSKWKLNYTTAENGTATLIDKHLRSLRGYKVGDSVPFRLEQCPQFTMQGDKAKKNESWIKELLYAHLQDIPALQDQNKVRLCQWDSMFIVLEISSGSLLSGAAARFVVFDSSPWGTHQLCCTLQLVPSPGDEIKVNLGKDKQLQVVYGSYACVLPIRPLAASSAEDQGASWRIVEGRAEKIKP